MEDESVMLSTRQLHDAIEQLIVASKLPARSRQVQVQPLARSIVGYAYEHGLDTDTLTELIDLARQPSHLDQTTITTLIKGLYPSDPVPSSLICNVVSSLGQGERMPSLPTQNLLLRWIVMVQEVLQDTSILAKLYNAIFNLLDMMSIRPSLCHLLVMITRRTHVKPYRIQVLSPVSMLPVNSLAEVARLELSRTASDEPALAGLLRVYKEYYPEIIVGHTSGRVARFEHPDPEWRDRLRLIQEGGSQANTGPIQAGGFKVVRKGARRSQVSVLPEAHTYWGTEHSVSLEQIDGAQDFVENLERIELPSQLIAALSDPLLQKHLLLKDDKSSQRRIDQWLAIFLDSQLEMEESGEPATKELRDVLDRLLLYTRSSKVLPNSLIVFLSRYIDHWNGIENREIILELLSFLPLQPFDELYITIFRKVEHAIIDNSQQSFVALLSLYTGILKNWTSHLLTLGYSPKPNPLIGLVDHSSLLTLNLLAVEPTIVTQLAILQHLSTLAHTISHAPTHPSVRILTPPPLVVYLLTFLSPTAATFSSLTSTLATYKLAFEAAMVKPSPGSEYEYPRSYVNSFNGFLMDICNLVWRSRAFNTTDTNALGCLLPETLILPLRAYLEAMNPPQTLQQLFTLSYNPALVALSIESLREQEDLMIENDQMRMEIGELRTRHGGPVNQRSLAALGADGGIKLGWAEYRLEVLKWLGDRGVEGVGELMFCTMKLLMNTGKN